MSPSGPGHQSSSVCGACGGPLANVMGAQCPRCLLNFGSTVGLDDEGVLSESLLNPFQVRIFGDYELLEEIARGGMGVVYRARQVSLGREVAIKMILAGELAGKQSLRMFQREAHAAANLHHPNIVPVFEIGEHETQHYFTMRFVPGRQSIADWAATRRGQHGVLAAAVAQAARAVAHAHSHGVLHRDLKSANILWDADAGAQVTDFGLAKVMNSPSTTVTLNGRALGSPNYMAPEQAEGRLTHITTATDVYGLGAVLYELLSGRPPFAGVPLVETMRRVVEELPGPLAEVPKDLRTVCFKCLAKKPEDRYATAAALAEDLERFVNGKPVSAVPLTPAQSLLRWAQRRPRVAALVLIAIGSLVAAVAGTSWQWRKAELARRGETAALQKATRTVVDLYTQSGLAAAKEEDPTRAALWFAQAAVTPGANEQDREANLSRWMAWRGDSATPLRAFPSGVGAVGAIAWRPSQDALIVTAWKRANESAVWNLPDETRWLPQTKMTAAIWIRDGTGVAFVEGNTVRLREYPSGLEWAHVKGEAVQCLAASADGRWVAVGAASPFLWDPASGETEPLPNKIGVLTGLEFSRDGQRIVLTSDKLRGVCALNHPGEFLFPPVDSMGGAAQAFIGSGDLFMALTRSKKLLVMRSDTGAIVESMDDPSSPDSTPQAISADGKFIARPSASVIERPGKLRAISKHKNRFEGVAFSRDSTLFATASADDTVRLWRLPNGSDGRQIGWHQEGALSVAISPDKRFVASGQVGGELVRVWRVIEPPPGRAITGFPDSRIRLSREGRLLVPSGRPDFNSKLLRTRVYAVDTAEPIGPEITPSGRIMDAGFAPESDWVAILCSTTTNRSSAFPAQPGSGTLELWDFREGRRVGAPIPFATEPRGLSVHPGGHKIAVYGARGTLQEVDVGTGEIRMLHTNVVPGKPVDDSHAACSYSPDGRMLAAWGLLQGPLLWDTQTERLCTPSAWARSRVMVVDFHGAVLGSGSMESEMQFLSLPGGEPAAPAMKDSNWIFVSRFSSEGNLFLTAGRGRVGRVWDWRRNRLHCPALLHDDEIFAGTFVSGTECVATAGLDRTIRFWDRRTGAPLRAPLRQPGVVMNLTVSPDGRTLISDGKHGCDIRLYAISALLPRPSLPPEEALLLAEIEAAAEVGRGSLEPLSAEAWLQKWRMFRAQHPEWHRW